METVPFDTNLTIVCILYTYTCMKYMLHITYIDIAYSYNNLYTMSYYVNNYIQ